jgi:hypothetical protein
VTTEPLDLTAANAQLVEIIDDTPELNSVLTELLSPPQSDCPHVTTEPSDLTAANARVVEKIDTTPELNSELTELLSPSPVALIP